MSSLFDSAATPTASISRALLSKLSQHERLISIDTPLGADALIVESMSGQESMSELFHFEVDCLATSAHFSLKDLAGKPIQLHLRQANGEFRVFHTIGIGMQALGSDGGLARYRLSLGPWMHALTLRRDSFVFQDMSVPEILECLFRDYPQAKWRFDVRTTLPKRSLTMQYRETDYDFVKRLLAEEGLNFFFEHGNDSSGNASHTLVVFDDNAALLPCTQPTIRFHRAAVTETEDTITLITQRQNVAPNGVSLASWDYKSLSAVNAEGLASQKNEATPDLQIFEGSSTYRYADASEAERIARRRAESLEMSTQRLHAESTARALTVGSYFTFSGAPFDMAEQEFAVLSMTHRAANNFSAGHDTPDEGDIEAGTYRNQFTCVPRAIQIRPPYWLPKPVAPGSQVALVVGIAGEDLTTERDHRIKVQFPWQRGLAAASGQLEHPTTSNAPGNETAGTWVRVAEPSAGANWGCSFIPRIGQEVLLDFIAGDIDRPVVIGQLYNGTDAPPLHGVDNHPAALSGIRSQELAGSGSNHYLMDDTPSQSGVNLGSSAWSTQWNGGYLVTQQGNVRGSYRGTGFDMKTDAWHSLRAKQGLFLSTTSRNQATSTQLDSNEVQEKFKSAGTLAQALSDVAVKHQALSSSTEKALQQFHDTLSGIVTSDGKQAAAFTTPVSVIDSAAAIGMSTPASSVAYAGQDITMTAQTAKRITAAQAVSIVTAQTVSLFTDTAGTKVIAAQSPVSVQAHTGPLTTAADQSVTVTSSNGNVSLQAKSDILLASGGGYVRLGGGNIAIHCPAALSVNGVTHDFLGGGSNQPNLEPIRK